MFKQHPKVWSAVREYGIITVATLIMVIGIYVFKFPNNFSFGGVSGMAVLLAKLTSISWRIPVTVERVMLKSRSRSRWQISCPL